MTDTYANYAALAAAHPIGVDYRLLERIAAGSRLTHLAIHGGGIEPGTTELADYLAGSSHRYYSFDAMLPSGNSVLHLASTNFDEPTALDLVAGSDYVIAWHGCTGADPVTYISGLDLDISNRIQQALVDAGFAVGGVPPEEADGADPANLVNKGTRSMGVQLQLSYGLRQSFFSDFTRAGRDTGPRTPTWYSYTTAIRTALNGLDVLGKPQDFIASGGAAQPVRGVSSGVGDYGIPTLSSLTVDGMPLDAVTDALRLNQTARQAAGGSQTEKFWSSAARPNGDLTREVYEFSLTNARPVNQVTFALARVPQRAWIQYRAQDGTWLPLTVANSQTPAAVTITDSVPAVIPAGVNSDLRQHPQHFGAGHWYPQQIDVAPVTASRFRIIMARITSTAAPRGVDGQLVDYCLGIKNAAVSYKAASRADLPWLPQADPEHSVPLAGSQDVLGSQIDYVVRNNPASNLLRADGGVWRCGPQPIPQAVVSLHMDVRTSTGDAQVVDRLYVEPLTAGPTMNIYVTDSDPVSERFAPSNTPLAFPAVRPSTINPVADSMGVLFSDPTAALEIDNSAIQFDPRRPFLLSMIINPQYTSDDTATYTVLGNGLLSITIAAGVLSVALADRTVVMAPVGFGYNTAMPFAVAFDGGTLTVRTPWETRSQDHAQPPAGATPSALRLGAALAGAAGAYRLTSLFLAVGRPQDISTVEGHWAAPAAYGLTPGYGKDASAHTCANAILRMDPMLVTTGVDSVCPWGLIGGPGVRYEDAVWTPVPGNFTLRTGMVKFRPVRARHIKLEFTNLSPISVVPSGVAPLVDVSLFPSTSAQGMSPKASPADTSSGAVPAPTSVALQGAPVQYRDSARLQAGTAVASTPYLPTESLYAPDPSDAQILRRSSAAFPYLPLPSTTGGRFGSTGVHRYHTVPISMDAKTAYTVAIRQVLAYGSDPTAERDTEQYIELFHSTENLSGHVEGDPAGWTFTGSAMVTTSQPPWSGSRLLSATYISRRRVIGVQFAAQLSDPQQLVGDPDFDDPFLQQWRPVGDAVLSSSDQFSTTIGQMALVERGHAKSTWSAMEREFPTWGDIEDLDSAPFRPLWSEIEQASIDASDFGGIESLRGVTPAPAGRLYAAARVVSTGPLTRPLILQLINGDGRIIAEVEQEITAAQVTEFFVGATVHKTLPGSPVTWGAVQALGSWTNVEATGSWGDVSQDYDIDGVDDVRVRLTQQGPNGTDQWLCDSIAIFNDPVIWEISHDGGINWHEMIGIRNDPRGVFQFPALPTNDKTDGTQLRWRATGFAPNLSLSSVVIRPWYSSLNGAVPYHDSLQSAGASTSLADYYPDITQDPYFQGWTRPIPQSWWLAARQWQAQNTPVTLPPPTIVLPPTVVEGTDEGAPQDLSRHHLADAIVLNG
ncbi:poly-gamma-glutamate hydrolase family protein [Streptomyces sp. NPDC008079]|uniref:poly-gamma-glutamate hydrolase family protein n=1 Tax=Streptomyces sp. NPDC008079 TaxID=3364806 RepID=UPI0036DFCEE6